MKIVVTGGAGFLGSHVCEFYAKQGHHVVAIDNMTKFELSRTGYDPDLARDYMGDFLRSIDVNLLEEDIRCKELWHNRALKPDLVVHCAAQPAMTIAINDPDYDWSVNADGTWLVSEFACHHHAPMVNCSTIHIYGNGINAEIRKDMELRRFVRVPVAIDETHPVMTGHITPLHESKQEAERYIEASPDPATNFRLTGMYGPRQFGGEDHGWVANFAIRTVMGRQCTVYGTSFQVRDILYVKDAVAAIEAWRQNPVSGTYNIGGGPMCILSLGECLETLQRMTGQDKQWCPGRMREGDLHYFCCDNTKATTTFGWKPTVEPGEGLGYLLEWILENRRLFE